MIKYFLDSANIAEMVQAHKDKIVQGFTTNPTLMRKSGIKDYETFAKSISREISDVPISFEVTSDNYDGIINEAREIANWGKNVYVKIPITNTKGVSSRYIIRCLSDEGIKLNITAILTTRQVEIAYESLSENTDSIISVFAGRIADTGRNPMWTMRIARQILGLSDIELLWASTREVYNVVQADKCGCDIITVTPEILKKIPFMGKDLEEVSLETVRMFYNDARA